MQHYESCRKKLIIVINKLVGVYHGVHFLANTVLPFLTNFKWVYNSMDQTNLMEGLVM